MLDLLTIKLIPSACHIDTMAMYKLLQANFRRYKVEVDKNGQEDAKAAFEEVVALADELPTVHPIRMNIFLNYSVFLYENVGNKE